MDTTFQCDSLFHPAASPTWPFCKTAFASRANEFGMAVARAGRAIDNLNAEISPRGKKRKTCREVSALEDSCPRASEKYPGNCAPPLQRAARGRKIVLLRTQPRKISATIAKTYGTSGLTDPTMMLLVIRPCIHRLTNVRFHPIATAERTL